MSKQWRQAFSSTCGIYEEVTPSPALTKLRLKILTNMLRLSWNAKSISNSLFMVNQNLIQERNPLNS